MYWHAHHLHNVFLMQMAVPFFTIIPFLPKHVLMPIFQLLPKNLSVTDVFNGIPKMNSSSKTVPSSNAITQHTVIRIFLYLLGVLSGTHFFFFFFNFVNQNVNFTFCRFIYDIKFNECFFLDK